MLEGPSEDVTKMRDSTMTKTVCKMKGGKSLFMVQRKGRQNLTRCYPTFVTLTLTVSISGAACTAGVDRISNELQLRDLRVLSEFL